MADLLAAAAAHRDKPVKIWNLNGTKYPTPDAAYAAAKGFQSAAGTKPYWQLVDFELTGQGDTRDLLMKCGLCCKYYKYSNVSQWAKNHYAADFESCKLSAGLKRPAEGSSNLPTSPPGPLASVSKRVKSSSSGGSGDIKEKFVTPAQVWGPSSSN
jgi:hypothetical protein